MENSPQNIRRYTDIFTVYTQRLGKIVTCQRSPGSRATRIHDKPRHTLTQMLFDEIFTRGVWYTTFSN